MLNISKKSIIEGILNYSIFRFYCKNAYKFKPLEIPGLYKASFKKFENAPFKRLRPRYFDMRGDEDWTNAWPAARSFNYSAVPLPVRQGHIKNPSENNNIIPEKYANSELIKIPNFLHLTPHHIAKHCKALKKYCTKWPEGLDDVTAKDYFPLEFIQTDYIHSAPSIRDERSRVVTLKVELRHFKFDEREKFKFIKLIGPSRYDKETDTVIITADRCPSNRQNHDYLIYVLTALTKESKKFEQWELEVEESDLLKYEWEKSQFKENVNTLLKKIQTDSKLADKGVEVQKLLKSSVEKLYNEGDSDDAMIQYKQGVLKLFELGGVSNVQTQTFI